MVNVTIDDLTLLVGAIADGDLIEIDRQGAPDISRKVTKINFVTDIDNADIAAGAGIATSKLADAANFALINQTNVWGDFNQDFQDNRIRIFNPAGTFAYTIIAAAIAANRNATLPPLAGNDTFVMEAFAQALTNKTIDGDLNTILDINETQMNVSVGASGTILTSVGVGSPPTYQAAAGGGLTFAKIIKSVDETVNNSTTLQDDDELFYAVNANKTYGFIFSALVSSSTAADIKLHWTVPSGTTMEWIFINATQNTITEAQNQIVPCTGVGVERIILLSGRVITSGTAGDINLQWAQSVLGAINTIMHQGAYLIVWEIT